LLATAILLAVLLGLVAALALVVPPGARLALARNRALLSLLALFRRGFGSFHHRSRIRLDGLCRSGGLDLGSARHAVGRGLFGCHRRGRLLRLRLVRLATGADGTRAARRLFGGVRSFFRCLLFSFHDIIDSQEDTSWGTGVAQGYASGRLWLDKRKIR